MGADAGGRGVHPLMSLQVKVMLGGSLIGGGDPWGYGLGHLPPWLLPLFPLLPVHHACAVVLCQAPL